MSKDKKFSYELLGAHTDETGKFFPRGSIVLLSLDESKAGCFENKLKRIIDESRDGEIVEKATKLAEKQAEKIISNAGETAEKLIREATKRAEEIVSRATQMIKAEEGAKEPEKKGSAQKNNAEEK